ncbi:hypothetical protein FB462_3270 [Curtobacterium citreum]|nr:hypothetical protein FB462_3270 [Curtobacterium citreum]
MTSLGATTSRAFRDAAIAFLGASVDAAVSDGR